MKPGKTPAHPTPHTCSDGTSPSDAELLDACRADLAELGLGVEEQLELIGAIRCIVESVLGRKYGLHDDSG